MTSPAGTGIGRCWRSAARPLANPSPRVDGDGGQGDPRDLLGWDMLSEGRFLVLRFLIGVRATADTGRVELRIIGDPRQAPILNPVLRLGFRLFARRTQLTGSGSPTFRRSVGGGDPGSPPATSSWTAPCRVGSTRRRLSGRRGRSGRSTGAGRADVAACLELGDHLQQRRQAVGLVCGRLVVQRREQRFAPALQPPGGLESRCGGRPRSRAWRLPALGQTLAREGPQRVADERG